MSDRTKAILVEAMQLDGTERIDLAISLLHSLETPDTDHQALWDAEIRHRMQAYDRGEIKALSLEDAEKLMFGTGDEEL